MRRNSLAVDKMGEGALWDLLDLELAALSNHWSHGYSVRMVEVRARRCLDIARELRLRGTQLELQLSRRTAEQEIAAD
jgi:hypothetical protein